MKHSRRVFLLAVLAAFRVLAQQGAADLPPAAAEAKIARGLMLEHEGRHFLAPCRHRSYLNVEDVSDGGKVLAALKEFGLAPGRGLYVELLAVERGGSLQVSGINFVHTAARCLSEIGDEAGWRAVGLQSAWEAVAGAGRFRVERIGKPVLQFEYGAIEHEGERYRIAAPGASLSLAQGLCRLADGSALTGWQATLVLEEGDTLQGCAWER